MAPHATIAGFVPMRVARERSLQYLASDVAAVTLTLVDQDDGTTYSHDYIPPNIQTSSGGGDFTFDVSNLPTGTYAATVSAYMDAAMSTLGGTSVTSTFAIASGNTTAVAFPALDLAATPLGAWTVTTHVTIVSRGYSVSQYTYQLTETTNDSTSESVSSTATTASHSWGNVLA
ncbi:MAG: hypothetical protein KGR26_03345, partial [Cyanobacteria bacterium REEB65]|nr:hypothetical protein [Cyanobacteria bacterium REEB65]